jgi:prepilin-type N-terminal cleavage/methylation domain-containing protein
MFRQKRGFTLPEVLVVVFVIGIMASILIVNWRNNEKAYLVQRTAQEVAQNARNAQNMALSGKAHCDSNTVPCSSYGMYFLSAVKNSYIIFGDENESGANKNTYQSSSDILVETINIDSNVEIYSLTQTKNGVITPLALLNVVFSVPDGFTTINNDSGINTAIIKIRKVGTTCPLTLPAKNCKAITITNTGGVTVQ